MSWEAYRWTAKTPSELYHTLGPHGVDELVRNALADVWRELPDEGRSVDAAIRAAREVAGRNIAVWKKIKQPSPAAFFEDLRPTSADGHFRQAMVLCWMMMPRAGGRDVKNVRKVIDGIFERNIRAWEDDNDFFAEKRKPARKLTSKPKAKKPKKTKAKKKKK